jgi:hypothetical protein
MAETYKLDIDMLERKVTSACLAATRAMIARIRELEAELERASQPGSGEASQSMDAASSLSCLYKDDAPTPTTNIEKRVAATACRADEINPEIVNAGLDCIEQQVGATMNAFPHGSLSATGSDLHDSRPGASIQGAPVAWRYRTPTGWHATTDADKILRIREHHEIEPLFTELQPTSTVDDMKAWVELWEASRESYNATYAETRFQKRSHVKEVADRAEVAGKRLRDAMEATRETVIDARDAIDAARASLDGPTEGQLA